MEQQQKSFKRTFVLFGAFVLIAIAWKLVAPSITPTGTNTSNTKVNTTTTVPTVTYTGVDGKNAFDLLKASHTVIDENGFVTSIDGVVNAAPKYWTLYMNGTMAAVGAKELVTSSTDTIEWKLEAFVQ
ncbi:MAG: DUF4430 domain-containing protein [Candidatus Kerfeldbacteria bacterium]